MTCFQGELSCDSNGEGKKRNSIRLLDKVRQGKRKDSQVSCYDVKMANTVRK